MARKGVEERVKLQEKDEGDKDDIVIYKKSSTSVHYHNREDCRLLQSNPKNMDKRKRGELQRRHYAPCPECVIE